LYKELLHVIFWMERRRAPKLIKLSIPAPLTMSTLTRVFLTLAALGSLIAPIGSKACGVMPDGIGMNGPVFGTPVSAKGRFVYVNRISRRQLKHVVADTQQPFRPAVLKAQL
jgi:hypothetical protein